MSKRIGDKVRDGPSGEGIPRHGRELGFILSVMTAPEGECRALIYGGP